MGAVPEAEGEASPEALLLAGALLVTSIVVHEALHGLGYRWGGVDWSEIEFGFSLRGLAPYAHCTAALRCGSYQRAIALPGLVLGIPPLAVGLSAGHWGATIFAFVMLAFASGDALLLWTLRGVPRGDWVRDPPSKMGALLLGHGASEVAPALAFDLKEGSGPEENGQEESGRGSETSLRRALLRLLALVVVPILVGIVAGVLLGS